MVFTIASKTRYNIQLLDDFFAEVTQKEFDENYLNVFTPMRYSNHLKNLLLTDDLANFRQPLLNRTECRDQVEYLQRLCGKTSQQAMNIALELVNDMQKGTQYPPESPNITPGAALAKQVENLMEAIRLKKKETGV